MVILRLNYIMIMHDTVYLVPSQCVLEIIM